MDQQAIEQWIAANGGAGAVQYTTAKKRVPNPAFALTLPNGDANPQYAPGQPSTIEVTDQQWVNSKTGATLHVNPKDDGTFDVIENTGADPNKPGAQEDTPEKKNAAELQRQRERNAALPAAQDPAYETDADRRARADARIKQQGQDAKDADAKARQDKLDADAVAARNAPKPVSTSTTEPFIVQAGPDGKLTTTPNPNYVGEKPQQSTVKGSDGKTYLVTVKDGKATAAPVEGLPAEDPKGTPAEPEGAPKRSGLVGDAAAHMAAYDQWLNAELRRPGTKLTQDGADKLRLANKEFWRTALEEAQGIVNTQTGMFGQQQNQRSTTLTDLANRRTSATQIATMSPWNPDPKDLGGGPNPAGGLAEAIRNSRVDAQNFVTLSGANRTVPEVAYGPAAQSVNAMPLPGMAPGFNPRANAIGAGSIGAVGAPTGAPAATPPPAAPTTAPPARDDWNTNPGVTPINPAAGDPGNDPTKPVGLIQAPPHFLAASSRGYAHDPTNEIRAMIADPRMDNNVIRQVVAEDYPGYPIDELLGAA